MFDKNLWASFRGQKEEEKLQTKSEQNSITSKSSVSLILNQKAKAQLVKLLLLNQSK